MTYLILALLVTNLGLVGLLYSKIRRIDSNAWELQQNLKRQALNEFRQIESLIALHVDLKPHHSLPQMRQWAGSPDFLAHLAKTILLHKPSTVVECSSGVSTLVAARACQLNGGGHVFSLEHEGVFAERTMEMLRQHGVEKWATVIHAPLQITQTPNGEYLWYETNGLPDAPVDVLVIDGPPEDVNPMARYPAGPLLLPRLAEKGILLLDDANRPDERRAVELWLETFPTFTVERPKAEKGLAVVSRH